MDSLRSLLVTRIMDKVPNVQIRNMYGETKDMNERIDIMFSNGSTILKEW